MTDQQVGLITHKRIDGKTQETPTANAGMSVLSAGKWQSGPLPSQTKPEHRWRTRCASVIGLQMLSCVASRFPQAFTIDQQNGQFFGTARADRR